MKKRNIFIVAGVVALLALAAVPLVYAGPGHRGHMGGGLGPLARLEHAKEQLGLSDQQFDEIKGIFKSLHDQNAAYRDQMHGGFNAVMTTLLKNPNDVAAAQAIIDQQAQAERAMKSNLLNAASKALNVLTPDQRDKLGQMIAQRQSRIQRQ